MKKRIIALLLAFVCCLGAFITLPTLANKETAMADADESFDLLNGFENMRPDFTTASVGSHTIITRNTDKRYISTGDYSAKVRLGGYFENSTPGFSYPLHSNFWNFNYSLKNYTAITAKIYNAEDENLAMEMGLNISGCGNCMAANFTLVPGWNTITYEINHSLIQMYNGSLDGISGIYFYFDPVLSFDQADFKTVYFDDIKLIKATSEVTIVDLVTLDSKVAEDKTTGTSYYEICDFEKPYQLYTMQNRVFQDTPAINEIVDIRDGDLEEGIFPTSGNRCLKITTHARADGYQAYPEITISKYVLAPAAAKIIEDYYPLVKKSGLTAEEEAAVDKGAAILEQFEVNLVFDLYSRDGDFHFDLLFKDSVNPSANQVQPAHMGFWGGTWNKGKWVTTSLKISEVAWTQKTDDQGQPIGTDPLSGRGGRYVKVCDFLNNPGYFALCYPDYFNSDDLVLYLDNLHFEVVPRA